MTPSLLLTPMFLNILNRLFTFIPGVTLTSRGTGSTIIDKESPIIMRIRLKEARNFFNKFV